MSVTLTKLPYAYDALEPNISSDTMKVHHDKHHKTYVDKLNDAIKDTPYSDLSLNDIVMLAKRESNAAVFNNAAQAWNHGFYWHCLTPEKAQKPSDELSAAITSDFGSMENLIAQLQDAGEKHFGSGWIWLIRENGGLAVISTHDADTPLGASNDDVPLLTLDVWEHAYYLDRKNERPKYLAATLKNLINWEFVSDNFASAAAWQYTSK